MSEFCSIPPMKKKDVAQRHKLLHSGGFKNCKMDDLVKYPLELDFVVASMLLSMIEFKGYIWHNHINTKIAVEFPSCLCEVDPDL